MGYEICPCCGKPKRKIIGQKRGPGKPMFLDAQNKGINSPERCGPDFKIDITSPTTDLARIWQGHRYGLQSLKPCVEIIAVAQKPYKGKPVDCIVETGAGALWIDGGRIATDAIDQCTLDAAVKRMRDNEAVGWKNTSKAGIQPIAAQGRWPPNFCLSHIPDHQVCEKCGGVYLMQPVIEVCPECGGELEFVEGCRRVGVKRVKGTVNTPRSRDKASNPYHLTTESFNNNSPNAPDGYADPDGLETVDNYQCLESCPARKLGEQSGTTHTHATGSKPKMGNIGYGSNRGKIDFEPYEDNKGTAARYFHQSDWEHEQFECRPECAVKKLDGQAGERISGWRDVDAGAGHFWDKEDKFTSKHYDDVGGPSRFYHNSDFSHETAERLPETDPFFYCPKSPKSERGKGLDDFYWRRDKQSPSGFVRISQEEWEGLDKRERARGNCHSTVKPLSLLIWLAKLLSPPKEYAPRRLLVPFSGSGSEVCAAILSGGFDEIVGIELIQDYVDISESRADFWAKQPQQPELL